MAGAMHALHERQLQRIAVVDLDVHHGNGTEEIVKQCDLPGRLFFFSVHLWDHDHKTDYEFYPGSGKDDIVHANVINVPIAPLWRKSESSHSTRRCANRSVLDWGVLDWGLPDCAGAGRAGVAARFRIGSVYECLSHVQTCLAF